MTSVRSVFDSFVFGFVFGLCSVCVRSFFGPCSFIIRFVFGSCMVRVRFVFGPCSVRTRFGSGFLLTQFSLCSDEIAALKRHYCNLPRVRHECAVGLFVFLKGRRQEEGGGCFVCRSYNTTTTVMYCTYLIWYVVERGGNGRSCAAKQICTGLKPLKLLSRTTVGID